MQYWDRFTANMKQVENIYLQWIAEQCGGLYLCICLVLFGARTCISLTESILSPLQVKSLKTHSIHIGFPKSLSHLRISLLILIFNSNLNNMFDYLGGTGSLGHLVNLSGWLGYLEG